MLEAVRGKLQRFLTLLDDKVSAADSSSESSNSDAAPASKTEEKGGEEEEDGDEGGADGGSSTKKEGRGGPVSVSAEVEMQELFFKLTLDTIGEIAFGRDLGSLRYGVDECHVVCVLIGGCCAVATALSGEAAGPSNQPTRPAHRRLSVEVDAFRITPPPPPKENTNTQICTAGTMWSSCAPSTSASSTPTVRDERSSFYC